MPWAPIQVEDDQELLEVMTSEMREADEKFRPTHFWKFYEDRFLPEVRSYGLKNFRRRYGSVLSSFGGTDPDHDSLSDETKLIRRIARRVPVVSRLETISPRGSAVTRERYRRVGAKFNRIGFDLRQCPTSLVGNPEHVVKIEGQPWTATHLEYCSLFADAARHVKFPRNGTMCELGTGLGRNAEIWARLFPLATILMFDIPPQLYVANQYMAKVFGARVIGYREATRLDPTTAASRIAGKVLLLPSWRMPMWSACKIDMFWNSASFQEMEPEVVSNYLSLVKCMDPRFIYINAMPGGNHHPGKAAEGGLGTHRAVTDDCYKENLADRYELLAEYDSDHLDGGRYGHHGSYVFSRRRDQPDSGAAG